MATSDYAESERHHGDQSSTLDEERSGGRAHGHDLLGLQRSAGNRAVSALVQAKLQVGAVDDPLEHEADQVAARVVEGIQRQGAPGCGCHDHPAAHTGHEATTPTHGITTVRRSDAGVGAAEHVHRSPDPGLIQRKAYDIGTSGEQLEVGVFVSKAKRVTMLKEAEQIITDLKATYDVTVSSPTTIEAIKANYTEVKTKVLNSLRTRPWRIQELRSLSRALSYYAAIMGANRASSTRAGRGQEVTSVGKVDQAINKDTPAGKLDTTTLGEYFKDKKNMGLFTKSEGFTADFSDVGDQLTGTFVHEIAHGLLGYAQSDFIAKTGYWLDEFTKLPEKQRTERPITSYARTNAAEDMCESAMFYFVAPDKLKKKCPVRHAFMEKIGKDWLPPPALAPQVQPTATVTSGTDTAASYDDSQVPLAVDQASDDIEKVVDKAESTPATSDGDVGTSDDESSDKPPTSPPPSPSPSSPSGDTTPEKVPVPSPSPH